MKGLTVKEVIAELSKRSADEIVVFEWEQYPQCDCLEYCYCTTEAIRAKVCTVDPFRGVCVMRGEKI
jgi:hypothetical protein